MVFFKMKTGISSLRLSALSLALCTTFAIHAQENIATLPETVITATRVVQPLTDLLADVTIIDRSVIDRSGASAISDLLVRVPGFEMVRNGGPGTTTSVYIRGAESRFTAVYIDGVRVDSQSTGGASWEAIPLAQIDRIEILRGPASAVYGSDAMGGAIQIFTRKGEGEFAPFVAIGAGTYGTAKLEAGFSGSGESTDYALSIGGETSRGFSARTLATQNQDDDGYRKESASLRLGFKLTTSQRIEASVLSNDMTSQYDSAGTTKDDQAIRLLQTGSVNWRARWSDAFSTTASVTESTDRYKTQPTSYLTITNLRGYLFQNEFRSGAHLLTGALERREDMLNNADTTPRDSSRFQNAIALGYGWNGPIHTFQVNARRDADSEFGGQTNGSAAYGFSVTPHLRAIASAGTSFRAPTLYQRFSKYGTADVLPESSQNSEIGLRYTVGPSNIGVNFYNNNVTNLINFVSKTGTCQSVSVGCYLNTAKALYKGVTISGEYQMNQSKFKGSLDLQDPRDGITGKLLARRSTHHATLGFDTQAGGWDLGVDLQLSSLRYDDAANTTVLPDYVLTNVVAQKRVSKEWNFLARIDNATDAKYQLADTYATPGRSLYLGLKWAP
jgi:vitamin B12 transporter